MSELVIIEVLMERLRWSEELRGVPEFGQDLVNAKHYNGTQHDNEGSWRYPPHVGGRDAPTAKAHRPAGEILGADAGTSGRPVAGNVAFSPVRILGI